MNSEPCAECRRLAEVYREALQQHADTMSDFHLAIAAWDADQIRAAKRAMRRSEKVVEECMRHLADHEAEFHSDRS